MKTLEPIIKPMIRACLFLLIFAVSFSIQAQPNLQSRSATELRDFYKKREHKAPQVAKEKLNTLRDEIKEKDYSFKIGYTGPLEKSFNDLLADPKEMPPKEVQMIRQRMTSMVREGFPISPGIDVLPSTFDARDYGWVTPVGWQMGCRASWVFAAVAMFETNYIKQNNTWLNVSEQVALDCCNRGGCGGGYAHWVYDWMIDDTIALHEEGPRPFWGMKLTCETEPSGTDYYATSWEVVRSDGDISKIATVPDIKRAILQYGAVQSDLLANMFWEVYTEGVLNGTMSDYANPQTNYSVLIIGWDDDKQAFLFKNSWGTHWGLDGFGWVRYGHWNIGHRATVLTAKKTYPQLASTFQGTDGAWYYVREVGTEVLWFGEDENGNVANVFHGTRSGNTIKGRWADIPKGQNQGSGELTLSVGIDGNHLYKLTETGGFDCHTWDAGSLPSITPGPKSAGYTGSTTTDLNGLWKCTDAGSYYIRQDGNNIYWFGEGPFDIGRPAFANVAAGTRDGNSIILNWTEVPKASGNEKGTLVLQVNNTNEIVKISGSEFPGTRWTRVIPKPKPK